MLSTKYKILSRASIDYSLDCGYIDVETRDRLMKGYDEVRKMLISMINHPEKFCKK